MNDVINSFLLFISIIIVIIIVTLHIGFPYILFIIPTNVASTFIHSIVQLQLLLIQLPLLLLQELRSTSTTTSTTTIQITSDSK